MTERDMGVERNLTVVSNEGSIVASHYAKTAIKNNRVIRNNENALDWWTEIICSRFKDLRGNTEIAPDISVVVPAYNEEKFILQLLDSVSRQKLDKTVEVVMEVNDSTDRTSDIGRKCGVTVDDYVNEGHPPVAYARQRGLEKANGKIVVSVDADMVCDSDKWLENLTKPLFENQSTVLACGGIKHYDGKWLLMLNPIDTILRRRTINKSKEAIGVGFSNLAFRRDIALATGGWPQTPVSEDIELVKKMMKVGKVEVVEKAVMRASGRRQMASLKEQIKQSKLGGNHFYDGDGKLKVVR